MRVFRESTKEFLVQSPTANIIYYRGQAWIKSTFIYDLCVTDGHIVIRGVFEFFIVTMPCGIYRGLVASVRFFWKLLRGFYFLSIRLSRALFIALRPVITDLVVAFVGSRGLNAVFYDVACKVYYTDVFGNPVIFGYAREFIVDCWLRFSRFFVRVDQVILRSIKPVTVLDYAVFIVIVPFYFMLVPVFWVVNFLYSRFVVYIWSICFIVVFSIAALGVALIVGLHTLWHSGRVVSIRVYIGRTIWWGPAVRLVVVLGALVSTACHLIRAATDTYPSSGRFGRLPVGSGVLVSYTILFLCAAYFLFIFDWLHFYDQYLILSALDVWGLNLMWSKGIEEMRPYDDWVQYENGNLVSVPNWWRNLQAMIARLPYLVGVGISWSTLVRHHIEFTYLVVAGLFFICYVSDTERRLAVRAVALLRLTALFVFISRFVIFILGSDNPAVSDLLFVHMYVVGGWVELVISLVVSLMLVGLLGFQSSLVDEKSKYFYVALAAISVLAYGALSLPFCNDFLSIFLTTELFSVGGWVLVLSSTAKISRRSVLKYFFLMIAASMLLVFGMALIYGITAFTDLIRIFYGGPAVDAPFSRGYVVFIAGLLLKLCSVPLLTVMGVVYTKTSRGTLVVLSIVVEAAILGFLLKVVFFQINTGLDSTTVQLPLLTLLSVAVLVSGVASIRAHDPIGGLLYSSVQHTAFLLLTWLAAHSSIFSVASASMYFVFYVFNVFFVFVLLGLAVYDGWNTTVRLLARGVVMLLALSLAGMPPFLGFYMKLMLFVTLSYSELWVAVLCSMIGGAATLIFYGRMVADIFYIRPVRRAAAVARGGAGRVGTVVGSSIVVLCGIFFILASIFVAPIAASIGQLSMKFLSPTLHTTDHRYAFITAAFGTVRDYRPNLHMIYSWPSLYWFMPLLDWHSYGDPTAMGHLTSFTTAPFQIPVFPKPDSRYFWLAEWLMFPFHQIPDLNETFDLGATFERVYRPYTSQLRMLAYQLLSTDPKCSQAVMAERMQRLSPVYTTLLRALYDKNIVTPSYGKLTEFYVWDENHALSSMVSNDPWGATIDTVNAYTI